MIFYFTGTGNSLFAAQKLAEEGEEIISIVEALRSKTFSYVLKENEKLGFVFPVYFYTVSDPVLEFVRKLTVENAGFVYAVIPCGASIGAAGGFLKSELKKRGLELQRVDALVVPDGALLFYDIDSPEKMEQQLEAAEKELATIRQAIDRREGNDIRGSAQAGMIGLAGYHAFMGTKAFYADEKCIGCGKCASICPAGAIEMAEGRPAWTKKKCFKCCGCINRCPVSAIQYGKKTAERGRYVNPVLK
ncbi:MAG: EFR1 family ferrodoxin [Oscillospiraceae bacterium]|nr:EFR1 family ferrodoxin [Oscillospiraceae bacterium]